MITPAFHFQVLENFIDIFNSNSQVLVELLEKEVGNPGFNVADYVNLYSLDVLSGRF